jgi:hypothetical protein
VLVSGCGGGSNATPGVEDAKPFADSFVHRLVEVGTSGTPSRPTSALS